MLAAYNEIRYTKDWQKSSTIRSGLSQKSFHSNCDSEFLSPIIQIFSLSWYFFGDIPESVCVSLCMGNRVCVTLSPTVKIITSSIKFNISCSSTDLHKANKDLHMTQHSRDITARDVEVYTGTADNARGSRQIQQQSMRQAQKILRQ